MPPPTHTIPLSALESEINALPHGRSRNPPIKLRDCALKELVQYKCNVRAPKEKGKDAMILCEPVVRLLRMCENGLSVETTAWEGWRARREEGKVER